MSLGFLILKVQTHSAAAVGQFVASILLNIYVTANSLPHPAPKYKGGRVAEPGKLLLSRINRPSNSHSDNRIMAAGHAQNKPQGVRKRCAESVIRVASQMGQSLTMRSE
jgi:hypothetical protein